MSPEGFLFWFIICIIVFAAGLSWLYDWYKWNGGKCRSTGEKWMFFMDDANRDRMYTTPSGERCVISWGVDKK